MISGYRMFYLKRGEPILTKDKDEGLFGSGIEGQTEVPLTLKSVLVPVNLEESAKQLIADNGNTVLTEEVTTKWCNEIGIEIGQD